MKINLQKKVHRLKSLARQFYFKEKELPTLVIAGTQKGGTTSLFDYLCQHPEIKNPTKKEIHYFDVRYNRSFRWYKSHFPATSASHITIEASPYYMFHPYAIERLAKYLPNAKLIIMLRNPADRAYSHYQHNMRSKKENRTFFNAIKNEIENFHIYEKEVLLDNSKKLRHRLYSYLHRGLYSHQIERIYKYFPKENVFIIKSENFFEDPFCYLKYIYQFLNLSYYKNENLYVQNKGNYRKEIDSNSLDILKIFYQEELERIKIILGKNFQWNI